MPPVLVLLLLAAAAAAAYRFTRRVEGSFFDHDGVRLHFTDEGDGTPVILLHGFAVNADLNWRLVGLTQSLAKYRRVVALDLRGHGLSDKPHDPAEYGALMAEDVVALLDHLKIQRAHVVGYSLGGIIALKLAVAHPERLLSVSPLGAGWEDPDDSDFVRAMGGIADALESGRGVPPLSGSLGGARKRPGLLHTTWVRVMTRHLNDGPALGAMVRGLGGLILGRNELETIAVPVCSIVGSADPMLLGVERMRGAVPDHTIHVIEGADHIQAVRRPELRRALLAFLADHAPGE
ncbi:MAG: alpha/beta fold hydrolase [Myxococcales bacterium]|nr:alpha/beta fold hydrolase [Myxococcales bacterium]